MSDLNRVPHKEKIVAGIGGFVSIFVTFWITRWLAETWELRLLLIASMGATAVLLFAAPHGPLSQPWNVMGGHLISAVIGVTLARGIDDAVLGGALAVGTSITVMYYLRCLHPPGGATSLIPFLAASVMPDYGYRFVLFPIGLGALSMAAIAVLFNAPFAWRRYPQSWFKKTQPAPTTPPPITHADLVAALAEIETFVDVSEEDLLHIYEAALRRRA
ncbi:MAG: HPP family protein [Planctomycetota bacterium]